MLIGLGVLLLVLAVAVGGGLWYLTDRCAGNVDRVVDVVRGIPDRPAQAARTSPPATCPTPAPT